ncbi:peroxidase 56-like [Triticum dicoccoides]|uniref:peroxidase 56-like n=1 Tax=Triticum dicoccoides TaxID=85692 RepID=UPI001891CD47|nr:peroxidase 56-like [Triticum dicoccoides]
MLGGSLGNNMMKGMVCLVAVVLVLAGSASIAAAQAAGLKKGFYKKSCPQAEDIAQKVVWKHVAGNRELAAKFLRMFFHDCFVRGCDASVLLDSPTNTAEKDAPPNLSLAGFEVIDEVKAALERACPGVVSCADIVALAARDSVSFQYGKKLWEVETGRRDGTVSSDTQALNEIPAPSSTFDILLTNFSGKGLGLQDLVVLSGGHTIGIGNCNLFSSRLFNFTGKNNPTDTDPSLNPPYAKFLQGQCRRNQQDPNDNTTVVPMDPGSSTSFDSHYFVNLKARQGMFTSDATLLTNARAAALVDKLQDNGVFFDHFKNSIKRMGQIGVLNGASGQIRNKCNVVNS